MTNDAAQRRSWTFYEAVSSLVKKFVLFVAKYFAKPLYKDEWVHRLRPLQNVQFCSRPRKAKILTKGIH
jgi:hypothetical protein